jgi:hypothetical protein
LVAVTEFQPSLAYSKVDPRLSEFQELLETQSFLKRVNVLALEIVELSIVGKAFLSRCG